MADSLQEALEALNEATAVDSTYAALVINNDLRTITVPPNFIFGVYNDKNVLSIDFEMPRYYDDIDLSTFSIQINYLSASNVGNIYEVENPVVEEDRITFEWLLDRGVFLKAGDVTFIVCLRLTGEGGTVIQEFNTTVAKGKVLDGLEVEDPEDPEAYSIIAHLREIDTRVTAQARQVATDCAAIGSIAAEAQEALDEANAGIAEIKEKYGTPLVASTAAAMTDQTKIYVYTGNETGYTFGNWYYWDGTAWTSGGVYNSAGVNTDSTLSVSGMPADAKKTGDEISGLKEDLEQLIDVFTDDAKQALLDCLSHVAWIDANGQTYVNALQEELFKDYYNQYHWAFPGDIKTYEQKSPDYNVNIDGYSSLGVYEYENNIRMLAAVDRGKLGYVHRTEKVFYDFFPIPIPADASSVTITITPNTLIPGLSVCKLNGDHYERLVDGGWGQAGGQTLTFTPEENQFISINIKNSTNTAIASSELPTAIAIDFE